MSTLDLRRRHFTKSLPSIFLSNYLIMWVFSSSPNVKSSVSELIIYTASPLTHMTLEIHGDFVLTLPMCRRVHRIVWNKTYKHSQWSHMGGTMFTHVVNLCSLCSLDCYFSWWKSWIVQFKTSFKVVGWDVNTSSIYRTIAKPYVTFL